LKALPWHGQLIVPLRTSATVQSWCVQAAENALNFPVSGWVTTILRPSMTLPPPTGTSVV
jgi:hypothetical protein